MWHINLSKLVNLLTFALFFHSLHIVLRGLFLLTPLVVLLSPLVLKVLTYLSVILLLNVLWNKRPSDLRHVAYNVM